MEDSLETTKKEIMSFINSNGLNLFVGIPNIKNKVRWNPKSENWKDFLEIARNEDVRTIVYDDLTLKELLDDSKAEIDQIQKTEGLDQHLAKEIEKRLESYFDIADQTVYIQLSWVKEGVCYYFQLSSSVFDEVVDLKAQIDDILSSTSSTDSLEEQKRELSKAKETLVNLSEEIANWAKSENLKKVTRSQVSAYLVEKEIYVSYENKLTLIEMVNKKLRQ